MSSERSAAGAESFYYGGAGTLTTGGEGGGSEGIYCGTNGGGAGGGYFGFHRARKTLPRECERVGDAVGALVGGVAAEVRQVRSFVR
ncbi:MAG: hypothetical protein WBV40_07220 [Candidatus Cybelea sp.]